MHTIQINSKLHTRNVTRMTAIALQHNNSSWNYLLTTRQFITQSATKKLIHRTSFFGILTQNFRDLLYFS